MENEKSEIKQLRKETEANVDPRVDLSVERTELALERTQLAWIRTVLSLIAGGIGLDKGMEAIHKTRLESGNALVENAHAIGISLSITATILIIITTVSYIRRCRSLARLKGVKPIGLPPGAIGSIIVILLGGVISFLLLLS
jgi:putative membrane protein